MKPQNEPNSPPWRTDDASRSYLRELARLYLSPPGNSPAKTGSFYVVAPTAPALPRECPLLEQPQTVEQIIQNGYFSVPPGDPVTALIDDRKHTSWLGLDDTIYQLRLRLQIYRQNVDDIEQAKLAAANDFHGRKNALGVDYTGELAALNQTIIKLYEQQRGERVSLWRDLSRLRQALPESLHQYLSASRKSSLLDDSWGDPW